MTERTWSQSSDDATDPDIGIVLAQADAPAGLSPTGPLEPTGPLDPTASDAAPGDAASESSGEATSLPRNLVEVEEAIGTPEAAAAGEGPPSTPATVVAELDVEPLGVGERRVLEVQPGTLVTLDDPAFAPEVATYVVNGNDLIVTTANGGVLVLTGFFAPTDIPPRLSVLGAPATTPAQLLARAEEVTPPEEEAAAGPPNEPQPGEGQPVRGGSEFRAYNQGDIGDGLDPLGPLGPTALVYTTDFPELNPLEFIDDGDGDGGNGPPPPPDTLPPQVELRAPFEATIGEQSGPAFNPVTTPVLPIRGAGQQIPDSEVNSVDQRNLTLDIDREVFIRFVDENSFSVDSLFVHDIGPNGEIQNVRLVFDGVNKPGDPLSNLKETPIGTEFSIGTVTAGTKLGFVTVNDGLRLNDFANLEGGRFEVRDRLTGEPTTIFDFHDTTQAWQQPRVVHIADDGTVTPIRGSGTFFTADASQQTPLSNRLNPEGEGAIVSGWDDDEGLLVIGVEDSFTDGQRDFAGLVFGVRFGSPTEKVLVIDGGGGLGALIDDPDSTEMVSATIVLTGFDGDRLVLDPAIATGTGITVTRVSDTEFTLEGLSLIENYETVISAATIEVRLDDPILGERDIAVTVEDPDGNTGSAVTSFTVDENLIIGDGDGDGNGDGDGDGDGDGPGDGDGDGDGDTDGSGDDVIVGTSSSTPGVDGNDVISGRAGDDVIDGLSGNDFIDGGDGKDTITVRGSGNNTIIGGPQPDLIILSTGSGTDVVRINGLSDGKDTIRNFNATEGDRLDLTSLFRDSDISADTFGQFVRTSAVSNGVAVQVDLDGAGGEQRFADIAVLERPVGVTPSTDPSSFVITPDNDPAVT